MLALPFAAIGLIIALAWRGHAHVEPTRTKAAHQRELDLECLAENIYYEARGEPLDGQYAIAEVTLNRLRSPYFPKTICGVVHDTRWDPSRRRFVAHFSWTDDNLGDPWGPKWKQAMRVATTVYDDAYMPLVPDALYYHAVNVHPRWASQRHAVAKIGNHIFYR